MKARLVSIILAIVLYIVLPPSVVAQTSADGSTKRNVLFLNSYENGYQWSDTILEGIKPLCAITDLMPSRMVSDH